jgi:hypothetical protein
MAARSSEQPTLTCGIDLSPRAPDGAAPRRRAPWARAGSPRRPPAPAACVPPPGTCGHGPGYPARAVRPRRHRARPLVARARSLSMQAGVRGLPRWRGPQRGCGTATWRRGAGARPQRRRGDLATVRAGRECGLQRRRAGHGAAMATRAVETSGAFTASQPSSGSSPSQGPCFPTASPRNSETRRAARCTPLRQQPSTVVSGTVIRGTPNTSKHD